MTSNREIKRSHWITWKVSLNLGCWGYPTTLKVWIYIRPQDLDFHSLPFKKSCLKHTQPCQLPHQPPPSPIFDWAKPPDLLNSTRHWANGDFLPRSQDFDKTPKSTLETISARELEILDKSKIRDPQKFLMLYFFSKFWGNKDTFL